MIPDELKQDLDIWFDKRIKEWGELKKLHYSLLGIRKEDYPVAWQGMIDDVIFTYSEIGDTLIEGTGEIRCMPREIKQDIVPYIRRKAAEYSAEAAKQAFEFADMLQNLVPICSARGTPQGSWLRRRGYSRDDLVKKDGITQVGKKVFKGLELE